MIEQLIQLLIYVLIFGVVAYGIYWICTKFALPAPIMWIAGVILLIILLLFVASKFGGGHAFHIFS